MALLGWLLVPQGADTLSRLRAFALVRSIARLHERLLDGIISPCLAMSGIGFVVGINEDGKFLPVQFCWNPPLAAELFLRRRSAVAASNRRRSFLTRRPCAAAEEI